MIYGYVRVSTIEQTSGSSLADQQTRIKGVAMMRGGKVAEIFTDGGVSGAVPLSERPAGRVLMDSIQAGDVIIASKLDRLFRSASDALLQAERFKGQGVDLIVADMGSDPVTQNGTSRMFFGMLALMAEFERDRIRERQREGIKGKKAKNGYIGGRRPYGFQIVGTGRDALLVEDEREQEAIRTIHALRETGAGYMKISMALQAQGYPYISHMGIKRVCERVAT
jgi:DNA invertase Pin-like site-specific DNA recombinase